MMSDVNSKSKDDQALITVCSDKTPKKPLARKAADALKTSRRKSVLSFRNKNRNSDSDETLQHKWFSKMIKNATDDQPESSGTARRSSDTNWQEPPQSPSTPTKLGFLMESFRHRRGRSKGASDRMPETHEGVPWSPRSLRSQFETGFVRISSPVPRSSPIPIPNQATETPFVPLKDMFSTPGSDGLLSQQVFSELHFDNSPPFSYKVQPSTTPCNLRDATLSPMPGTVFSFEDNNGALPNIELGPEVEPAQEEEVRESIEEAMATDLKDEIDSLPGESSLPVPNPFESELSTEPDHSLEDLSSMRLGCCEDDVCGTALGKARLVDIEESENRSAWKEFLSESKHLLHQRQSLADKTSSEYPTIKALRDGLSKRRLQLKGLMRRSEDHGTEFQEIPDHVPHSYTSLKDKESDSEPLEVENARYSLENDTYKEVNPMKRRDSTVRLIRTPSSDPRDTSSNREYDTRPSLDRSTHRSSFDLPCVDIQKNEERVDTEFACGTGGLYPVKLIKAPSRWTQGWYMEEPLPSYRPSYASTSSHSPETSSGSDEPHRGRIIWRRPNSLASVLSEATSMEEDDHCFDNRSLIDNIMSNPRTGRDSLD